MANETMLSEFNYFEPQSVQTSVEEEYDEGFAPAADVSRDQPIDFVVKGATGLYRDLNNSYLVVKCKVTKADKTDLDDAAVVAPVNNLLHSLFQSIDVYINGVKQTESNTLYAYRAYLEKLLGYEKQALKTRAIAEGFTLDTSGAKMDVVTLANDGTQNVGFVERQKWINGSRVLTLVGRPHCDLFHQDRDIPGGVTIQLRMTMNKDPFVLLGAATLTHVVQVLSARLVVRTKKLTASLVLAHTRMLSRCNYRLPLSKVSVSKRTLANGAATFELGSLFTGSRIPNRVVFAMVTNAASAGAYNLNPFRFQNFGLTSLSMKVNQRMIPFEALEMDYARNDYNRAYLSTLAALGMDTGNRSLIISPADWAAGYNIYAFKLTAGPSSSEVLTRTETGEATLKLTFAAALTAPVDLILYTETPSLVEIDALGSVVIA